MASTMHTGALVLACLACAGLGRRVQAPSSESEKSQVMAALRAALSPEEVAAFKPSSLGSVRAGAQKRSLSEAAKNQAFATLLANLSPEAAAFNPSSLGPVSAGAQKHGRSQEPTMQEEPTFKPKTFVDKSDRERPMFAQAFSGEEAVRPELFPYAYAQTEWDKPEEEFDVKKLPGVSAPLGFFDPFGFTKGATKAQIAKFRECELKHGRVAMLAAWGMITADKFHPLFDNKLSRNPLLAIVQTPKLGVLQILLFIAFVEVLGVKNMKAPVGQGYIPGNFLYGFPRPDDDLWYNYQTRELNNGRLAMFGAIGMLVGSYLSAKGPLEVLETPGKILT